MMKRNLLLVCLMSGAALAIAQDNYPQQSQPQQQGAHERTSRETARAAKRAKGVLMQGGRVFFVKPDGQTQLIDREAKVGDMKVNPDGTVIMRDGNTMTLKDGDSVLRDGIMGLEMRDGKVYTMSVGGQTRELNRRDIMLMDGTKVMRDGRVTMKDGTTAQLSNGDMIGADGTMKKAAGQQRQQEQQRGTMNEYPGMTPGQTPEQGTTH